MTDSSRRCANEYSTDEKRQEKQVPFSRILVFLSSINTTEIDCKIHNICYVKKESCHTFYDLNADTALYAYRLNLILFFKVRVDFG
jgi:hypothetical protein